jgi:hypothetical protein
MKHHSTQPTSSEEELKDLIYSPEEDRLKGIEKYSDIFNLLENNTFKVDDQVIGNIMNFALSFNSNED